MDAATQSPHRVIYFKLAPVRGTIIIFSAGDLSRVPM